MAREAVAHQIMEEIIEAVGEEMIDGDLPRRRAVDDRGDDNWVKELWNWI